MRNLKADSFAVDHVVRRIGKIDQHAMWSGRQALDDQWLAARIHPVPGGVIKGDVYMADPRLHAERGRTEDRNYMEVVGAVLNHRQAARERVGERGRNNEPRRVPALSAQRCLADRSRLGPASLAQSWRSLRSVSLPARRDLVHLSRELTRRQYTFLEEDVGEGRDPALVVSQLTDHLGA